MMVLKQSDSPGHGNYRFIPLSIWLEFATLSDPYEPSHHQEQGVK